MDATVCFVCGGNVDEAGIYLRFGKTLYSKTTYPIKISQLIGDDFIVVVSKEDKVCRRCSTLIDRFDKLEIDMLEVKTLITEYLSEKYSLCSEETIEYASEDLEYSKGIVDHEDKDFLVVQRMENKSSFGECELLSPQSDEKDEGNNNPSLTMFVAPQQDVSCVLVKSETLRDCWTDQSLKTTTKINLSNNFCGDLTESKNLSIKSPVIEINTCKNETLPIFSPMCKSTTATSKCQDDHTLQEAKIEIDSIDQFSMSTILLENQQTKAVTERLKLENMPVSFNALECENVNIHYDEGVSEYKSQNKNAMLEIEAKRKSLNSLASKTKPVKLKSHKINLRPILPKTNCYVLEPKLPFCNHKTNIETNLRINKLERCISNHERDFEIKVSENVPLYEEHDKNIFINNSIKEEAEQDKVSADYRCKLCKTEFENVATLKNHVKQHSKNGSSYSCCFCSKTFKTKSGLYYHTSSNHSKKFKFCCELCGKGWTTKSALERHHSGHTQEYVCVCDVCGKKFKSRGTYWIHRKWHFNPRPYRCAECGQLFKHSSSLAVHKRRRHSNERPFKCAYCLLTFNDNGTFKRHLILHTKNYPFSCNMCKQGFTTRFKYGDHMLKAHSVVVDRPVVDKKDYKMAVYDDETEGVDLIENISESDSLVEGLSTELDTTVPFRPTSGNTTNNIVEIVFTPNILSDHISTLPPDWLT